MHTPRSRAPPSPSLPFPPLPSPSLSSPLLLSPSLSFSLLPSPSLTPPPSLMQRNALDAFTVWWLPGVVVSMLSFVLSLCYACIVAAIAYAVWSGKSNAGGLTFAIGFVTFLFTFAVMDGLGRVLLNCLDSVFLCYAIDRDTSQVHKQEIHAVFNENPGIFVAQASPRVSLSLLSLPLPLSPNAPSSGTSVVPLSKRTTSGISVDSSRLAPLPLFACPALPPSRPDRSHSRSIAFPRRPQPIATGNNPSQSQVMYGNPVGGAAYAGYPSQPTYGTQAQQYPVPGQQYVYSEQPQQGQQGYGYPSGSSGPYQPPPAPSAPPKV